MVRIDMIETVLLRFRDIIADSIAEHQRILTEKGYVWWGWWQKRNEPNRFADLAQLHARCQRGPIEIGLFDNSRQVFYIAALKSLVYQPDGVFVFTPEPDATPSYYRSKDLPVWFQLTSITGVDAQAFMARFSAIPIATDRTLFPVSLRGSRRFVEGMEQFTEPIPMPGNTILHITDVHFGMDFGFPGRDLPGLRPLVEIISRDVQGIAGDDIGLIIVSGDLTSRGDASYLFNNAQPFLHDLRQRLGLGTEHVVIVPGNHDICLGSFSLNYDHENAFNTFLQSFYGAPTQQLRLLPYRLPTGRIIEVLTVNSVQLRKPETSHYGWVNWQVCESLLESAAARDDNTLRMAVMHHHLVSALREERLPDAEYPYASVSVTLNAGAVIEGLQRHRFRIVVQGHQHTPSLMRISRGRLEHGALDLKGLDQPLYAVSGGSAGAAASRIDGDIRDNTYTLMRLDDRSVNTIVRAYSSSGNAHDLYTARLPI